MNTIEFKNKLGYIKPAFDNNEVVISFSCSNEYARYLAVTIESIIEKSNCNKNYDILILEYNISVRQKNKICKIIENKKNLSLRFVNLKSEMAALKISTWAHFSVVACFKLFLFSKAFSGFNKICIFDTDLIFLKDVALLYEKDISTYDLLACDDVIMKSHLKNDKTAPGYAPRMPVKQYLNEYLNFKTDNCYYNTGVCVLNLKNAREKNFFEKSFFLLSQKGYSYQEQDVLNELCFQNSSKLEYNWNVIGTENFEAILKDLEEPIASEYKQAINDPYVLHFAGGCKPWNFPGLPNAEIFFRYAKNTTFYEEILEAMVNTKILQVKPDCSQINTSNNDKTCFREILNLIGFRKSYWLNSIYIKNLTKKIKNNVVLLDSKNGTDLAGNIFRIICELTDNYKYFDLYLTFKDENLDRIKKILSSHKNISIKLIKWESEEFFKILARAKYVITDLYIIHQYVKREGQVLISTAHGTPIKTMGKDCHTETQGHLQRTHLTADFQLFPSYYMKSKLFSAFMENNLFTGKALKFGYPRNDIFFDKNSRINTRNYYGWENKKIYAYLPTFRGIAGKFSDSEQIRTILEMCEFLDNRLSSKQIMLIKLHNFVKTKIDLSSFKHIKIFPDDKEVYEVLNATDVLISDYSSVFFDYANTRNKIILFQYDSESYNKERGTYLNWKDVPFPIVDTFEQLWKEMICEKKYNDTLFLKKFCTFDNDSSTKKICNAIFNKGNTEVFSSEKNNRKNIFLFAGRLELNQYSTFFLQHLVIELYNAGYNCYIYAYEYAIFNRPKFVQNLYPYCEYFTFLNYPWVSYHEYIKIKFYSHFKHKYLLPKSVCKRECKKNFTNIPIHFYLDLSGKDLTVIQISKYLKCPKIMVTDEDNINSINYYINDNYSKCFSYINEIERLDSKSLLKSYSESKLHENSKKLIAYIQQLENSPGGV